MADSIFIEPTTADHDEELVSESVFMDLKSAEEWLRDWHGSAVRRNRCRRDRSQDGVVESEATSGPAPTPSLGECPNTKRVRFEAPSAPAEPPVDRAEEDRDEPQARARDLDAPLTTLSLWERVTGWSAWRKERQIRAASAEACAQYVGIDSWGEEDIKVDPKVGFMEWCRQVTHSFIIYFFLTRHCFKDILFHGFDHNFHFLVIWFYCLF